ncbi:hypothetical protein AAW14_01130 [Streptomyces hygroscopicus]|uniref:hypothetical protein n=1 Tax=Streptomyces hygroscopicus TaxID=1912 RepID=UPI00224000A3|nr:hypothetical protein [Streptomyces hygroscopicus]MCW7940670.1 hypothetical protein [Streptomyces hygroscopicus]
MKKLMSRIATTGISTVIAAGALFAAGGSAMAATPQTAGQTPARTTVVHTSDHFYRHLNPHRRIDPWVAGQLAMFEPAVAKRQAIFDPWVKDQLALFEPAAG